MPALIVIPVLNQLPYTTQCLDSLNRAGVPDTDIIVVNNGSTDGTQKFLAARKNLRVITNEANRGCSFAWNQGVQASTAEWTVILNNDVVVAPGFREGLTGFAEEQRYDIVSPAKSEGELDYDFLEFAQTFLRKMSCVCHPGMASGVGFMVHRRVFDAVGLFDTQLGRAGYEDEDFFRRARRRGFRLAVTGRAFMHHFGSVTQKSVKAEMGVAGARLSDREYFRKKHRLTWRRRRGEALRDKLREVWYRFYERRRYGLTFAMRRSGGVWRFD